MRWQKSSKRGVPQPEVSFLDCAERSSAVIDSQSFALRNPTFAFCLLPFDFLLQPTRKC
jgi:hypothetical protein